MTAPTPVRFISQFFSGSVTSKVSQMRNISHAFASLIRFKTLELFRYLTGAVKYQCLKMNRSTWSTLFFIFRTPFGHGIE